MKDFDSLIGEAERQKSLQIAKLEAIKNDFLQILVGSVKEWYQSEARKLISTQPDIAKGLGIEKLKHLKEEVNTLVEKTETTVYEYIDKKELWWHTNETPEYNSYEFQHRLPNPLNLQIRYVLGKLGEMMGKVGLVKIRQASGYTKEHDVWIENGKPCYPYGSNTLTDSVQEKYVQYSKLVDETQKINGQIEMLKKEKEETNIVDIWDSL